MLYTTLPNGKLIYHNNSLYQSNLLRLLTSTDYNTLNSTITNIQNSAYSSSNPILYFGSYTGNDSASRTISLPTSVRCVLVARRGLIIYNDGTYGGGIVTTSNRNLIKGLDDPIMSLNSNNTSITVYHDNDRILLNNKPELYIWVAWK